jgi:uncharacterized protein YggE
MAEAQEISPTASEGIQRMITVVGAGRVSLAPDIGQINVGVEARASTVSEAKVEVDRQMAAIVATLRALGLDDKDMQTSQYSIYYEREPILREEPGTSTGAYHVSSMLQLTVRDVDQVGSVLDAAVEAGANQVYGVQFTVSDDAKWQSQARVEAMADARARAEELARLAGVTLGQDGVQFTVSDDAKWQSQARVEAMADARARAEDLARLAGVTLGQVISVSEVIGSSPVPVYRAAAEIAYGGGGIAPGELELSTQVQVTYAIQ